MKHNSICMLILLSSLVSCMKELPHGEMVTDTPAVTLSVYPEQGRMQTRSSYTVSDALVSNYNLYVFNSSNALVYKGYQSGSQAASISVPQGQYAFYVLANMGDITGSVNTLDALKSYTYEFSTTSFSSSLPMYGSESVTVGATTSSVTVGIDRLFAKYTFRIDRTNIREGTLSVQSVTLRNVPAIVYPFDNGRICSTASKFSDSGDHSSASDISSLNAGNSVVFYVPENLQGNENGITSSVNKKPDYAYKYVKPQYCTYLETVCSYVSGSAVEKVTYRMYLGENATSDFNIRRNTAYNVTLMPNSANIHDGTWKCESEALATIELYNYNSVTALDPAKATVAEYCFFIIKDAAGNGKNIASVTADNGCAATTSRKGVGDKSYPIVIPQLNKAGKATFHVTTTDGLEIDYAITANKPIVTFTSTTSYLFLDGTARSFSAAWKKYDGTSITPSTFFNQTAAKAAFVDEMFRFNCTSASKVNISGSTAGTPTQAQRNQLTSNLAVGFTNAGSLTYCSIYLDDNDHFDSTMDELGTGSFYVQPTLALTHSNITTANAITCRLPWMNNAGILLGEIHDYSLIPVAHLKSGLSHSGSKSGFLPAALSTSAIPVNVSLSKTAYTNYADGITYTISANSVALKYSFSGNHHPAGRHTLTASIPNPNAQVPIEMSLGEMDCYTHIPVGTIAKVDGVGQGGPIYDPQTQETLYTVDFSLTAQCLYPVSSSVDYPVYYVEYYMKGFIAGKYMIRGKIMSQSEDWQSTYGYGLNNASLFRASYDQVDSYPGAGGYTNLYLSHSYSKNGKSYSGSIGQISSYQSTSATEDFPLEMWITEVYGNYYELFSYTGNTTMGSSTTQAYFPCSANKNYVDRLSRGYYIVEKASTSTKFNSYAERMYRTD